MGSSLSHIRDDEEVYEFLCKKYKEKHQGLYSNHHDWLLEKSRGETDLDFKEYDRLKKIKHLQRLIILSEESLQNKIKEIENLKEELKILEDEKNIKRN